MHPAPSFLSHPTLCSLPGGALSANNQTLFSSKVQLRDHHVPETLTILSPTFYPQTKTEALLHTPYPIETSLHHAASSSIYPRRCLVCLIPTLAQRPRGQGIPRFVLSLHHLPHPHLQSLLRKDHGLPILHPCHLSAHPHTHWLRTSCSWAGRFAHTGRQMHDSRQTLTLLAIRILVHLPGQEALLVGGHRGVLGQLEERVAHLASWGRRLGLLRPGCVFFIPGHQRIRLGLLKWAEATRRHPCLRTPPSLLLGSHTSGPPKRSPPSRSAHQFLSSLCPHGLWLLQVLHAPLHPL